jgi:ribosomal protein L40E
VTIFKPVKPTECRRCGTKLAGSDPEPWRHQVWELPQIKPTVTEYQRHRLCCRRCGASTCAELPAGVPTSQAGPRLVALVALLMGCFPRGVKGYGATAVANHGKRLWHFCGKRYLSRSIISP